MGEKLILKRTYEEFDYSSNTYKDPIGSEKENRRAAVDFLKRAIVAAGFSPKTRAKDDYTDVKVFISEFGGKCWLKCTFDYDYADGPSRKNGESAVNYFELGSDDSACETLDGSVTYGKFEEIVEKLAKDLNKHVAQFRTLKKFETVKAA